MRLGQLQHLPFRELLQKAVQAMAEWPNPLSPSSTKMMTLPLLGGILDFCPPGATQFGTANGNLLTASSPVDEPGWSCTTAWSTGSRSKQQQQQRARAGAAAAWASLAAEELDFVADQLGLTTIPPGPSGQCQPYSAFAPLSSCLWPLWGGGIMWWAFGHILSRLSHPGWRGLYWQWLLWFRRWNIWGITDPTSPSMMVISNTIAIAFKATQSAVRLPFSGSPIQWSCNSGPVSPLACFLRPLHGGTLPLPEAHHQVYYWKVPRGTAATTSEEPLPKVKGTKPWGSIIDDQYDERLIMQPDEQFLALLETPCDEDKDQMARRYFYELTLAFLRPLPATFEAVEGTRSLQRRILFGIPAASGSFFAVASGGLPIAIWPLHQRHQLSALVNEGIGQAAPEWQRLSRCSFTQRRKCELQWGRWWKDCLQGLVFPTPGLRLVTQSLVGLDARNTLME